MRSRPAESPGLLDMFLLLPPALQSFVSEALQPVSESGLSGFSFFALVSAHTDPVAIDTGGILAFALSLN